MSEQETGNPTVWVPLSATSAAAFRDDVLGNPELVAVIAYRPNSESLRSISARGALQRLATARGNGRIEQEQPPTEEQIRPAYRAWAWKTISLQHSVPTKVENGVTTLTGPIPEEIAEAAAPAELVRRAGEKPDDFYRRIARAHRALAKVTDKPTAEIARRAGVPAGTAASWVHYARKRGLLEHPNDQGGN